ncbi:MULTISPECIES: hypothetical protein [Microbacterium]|uniref:Uncharacterized protein n=1 Tax=Microbacterium maritypicum TaxID=33918 RepID=A0A4Y4BD00_MICMQ|nr:MULTISPECIES: hypothetical protein [Microbacterium]QYG11729.1 hypothetical protein KY497_16130 [Microbacterium sp. PAMC22086]GEC77060.1 hypothetical protein MLI01_32050 [Microbacterium liquefaciens]GGV66157.1 hypothetical protein GCM10010213_32260 [Microbacterium liquefaciens]
MTEESNTSTSDNYPDGIVKPGGLGKDNTIPADPDGVAAGFTGSPSHFNAEEDESAEKEN